MTDHPKEGCGDGAEATTNDGPATDRRNVLKWAGAAGAGLAAGFGGAPTYLRDFEFVRSARAQGSGPVKIGFIEDESGNLSVYGLQKLHAAQLAVKEIIAGNMVGSPIGPLTGLIGGLAACALVAAVFGYFVFYGRVQSWIVPILTLVLTLLLETFLGQTAGYQWRVGSVQLGGYNGMTGIPWFELGGITFMGYAFYYYVLVLVLASYLALRLLVNSRHGKAMLAIREDSVRAELLGYDIRARQLAVFVLAAVLSGLSGLLYVQWGNYITPSQVGLLQASLPVIWVAVGGRESLLAVAISTYALNWLTYTLSSAGYQSALVITGALLVAVMMFFPNGIVVTLARDLPKRGFAAIFARRGEP